MNNNVVQLDHVSVTLNKISVLQDVNLVIKKGDFWGIIGPNGGGKTTLLNIILGILKPTSGECVVSSGHVLGYVPQYTRFERSFPIQVMDVVLMGRLKERTLLKRYTRIDRDIAAGALEMVEMADYKNRQMSKLSGGQQQRVIIARALAAQPDILLLDEPTASVDQQHGYDLYQLLKKLNKRGITIVMVSHDMSAISTYVNKIACVSRKIYYHDSKEITMEMFEATYGCNFELLGHGLPHRVLKKHEEKS